MNHGQIISLCSMGQQKNEDIQFLKDVTDRWVTVWIFYLPETSLICVLTFSRFQKQWKSRTELWLFKG